MIQAKIKKKDKEVIKVIDELNLQTDISNEPNVRRLISDIINNPYLTSKEAEEVIDKYANLLQQTQNRGGIYMGPSDQFDEQMQRLYHKADREFPEKPFWLSSSLFNKKEKPEKNKPLSKNPFRKFFRR